MWIGSLVGTLGQGRSHRVDLRAGERGQRQVRHVPTMGVRREGAHAVVLQPPPQSTDGAVGGFIQEQADRQSRHASSVRRSACRRILSVGHESLASVTLRIHRAERTDLLADGLAELLATPLADPFAEELVVVPARGVERWVTQRLSTGSVSAVAGETGSAPASGSLSPQSLVALLLGKERDDPWDPDRLVWPLLDVIDDSLGEAWCSTLARTPRSWRRRRGRRAAARAAGTPSPGGWPACSPGTPCSGPPWSPTGARAATPTARAARSTATWPGSRSCGAGWSTRVGSVPPDVRHAETLARLRAGGDGLDLPPRLSLFGHTRLPVTEVELLGALGELRDVHLWLPQVSEVLWDDLASTVRRRAGAAGGGPVDPGGRASVARARWGGMRGSCSGRWRWSRQAQPAGLGRSRRARANESLLGVAAGRPARQRGAGRRHACGVGCSRRRPVGAGARLPRSDPPGRRAPRGARRAARGRPDARAARHPRDVPGHRGLRAADPGRLRARRPARRGGAPRAPAPAAAGRPRACPAPTRCSPSRPRLVELAGGRVTATEVLDLASSEPVRRRFGFTDDDLAQLAMWVEQAAIRWGLDAGHRGGVRARRLRRQHLGGRAQPDPARRDDGRGRAPVRRRRAAPRRRVQRRHRPGRAASPSTSTGCAGSSTRRRRPPTIGQWVGALSSGVEQLTAVARRDAWQQAQFDRELAKISDSAGVVSTGSTSRATATGDGDAAAGRRPARCWRTGSAGRPDPGELPHRHAHRLHDGADAVRAAPRRLPARPRRRRLPAQRVGRRRRRARPRPDDGRARRAQRGPAAVPRRDPRGRARRW